MSKNDSSYCLFGLSAGNKLTDEICNYLNIKRSEMDIIRFADGEILTRSENSVRGKDVFVIQSTSRPVNENLMELLIALDALKRGSANSINVVIPYFGYARQDRKAKGRQPITCKLVANLITTAGANRVMTVDLHSPQAMGFFDVPVDDLHSTHALAQKIIEIINQTNAENVCIVSPDHGGMVRARDVSECLEDLDATIAVIDKRRPKPNHSEVGFVLGDIKDKTCFIVDDMIDTAGTITNAAKVLKKEGAKEVYILACHGVFSPPAKERLEEVIKEGIVKKVIVTNTIDIKDEYKFEGLEIISIADLIANMISAMIDKRSLSEVYKQAKTKLQNLLEKVDK